MGNNGSRQQGFEGQQQQPAGGGAAAPGSGAAGAQGGQTYAGTRTGGGPGLFHPSQDQASLFPPFPNGPRQVPPTPQLQLTETIRNDVNLKKQTLKLVKVPDNPHIYNLEFTFDAAAACTLSIWYLAEEKTDVSNNTLSFETQYPIQPQTAKFEKGLAQVYTQPLEEGFNLSLVQNRGLMYYHQGSQHFPVVIMLQTLEDNPNRVLSQSTFVTFKSNSDGSLCIAVVKQKIQVRVRAAGDLRHRAQRRREQQGVRYLHVLAQGHDGPPVPPHVHVLRLRQGAAVPDEQVPDLPLRRREPPSDQGQQPGAGVLLTTLRNRSGLCS
ncbi:hypothetical protein T484DRAFT_2017492 [Baffinella frigidus]|nr:hypothetical protein T484DRAFT_2017492 [Cryptophyta sp. CCMP2293]